MPKTGRRIIQRAGSHAGHAFLAKRQARVNDTEITVAGCTQHIDSQIPRCPLFLVPPGVHEVSQCHRLSFPRTSIQRRNTDLEQVDDIRLTLGL